MMIFFQKPVLLIYVFAVLVTCTTFAEDLGGTQTQTPTLAPTTTTAVEPTPPEFAFYDLQPCELSSLELTKLGPEDYVEPCIIADVHSSNNLFTGENVSSSPEPRSSLITMIQITPNTCSNHRDGSITAVEKLNNDNNGKGVAIGFRHDYYVKFRLISIVSGSQSNLGPAEYARRHVMLLNSTLQTVKPQYIVGSCSFAAALEKGPALEYQTIVSTQVGPPGFYQDRNPYVFGFHINSDTYPHSAVQQLKFFAEKERPGGKLDQPMRVIYRTKSEFFYSTCRSAIDLATNLGFTDIQALEYDPEGDYDSNGVTNDLDEPFLQSLADLACPSGSDAKPAFFLCTLIEQDVILERLKQNGCRPILLWATPSTWGWASNNPEVVPYFQGGGQWHKAFQYSDDYFTSGQELLDYNANKVGYQGNYDMVVSYAIPILYAQHIVSSYRIVDDPNPLQDFQSPQGYELLRRDFLILKADTIFGPVNFDENQRNVGRGAAATQWLPVSSSMTDASTSDSVTFPTTTTTSSSSSSSQGHMENKLVSPFLQAEAASVLPVPAGTSCTSGQFVNATAIQNEECVLCHKCDSCPINTFTTDSNEQLQCHACPAGSTTKDSRGQEFCTVVEDNLLSGALLGFAYTGVAVVWMLGAFFIYWIVKNKKDPVIRIGQLEFMVLICVGAMVSSSSVIFLSLQAGQDDDFRWATIGCRTAPFLYGIGWVIEYSSMSAKTYRLFRMMNNPTLKRIKVTAFDMYKIVFGAVMLDVVVLVTWTIVSPLEFVRNESGQNMSDGLVTIDTYGECKMTGDISIFAFVGPLVVLHGCIMIATNYLLYMVRNVEGRYQEQKYVAMASAYVFEVLVIGIPVLAAVQDSSTTRFIVLSSIVFLSDIGILCFVFIPKMMFLKEGLPEGVRVVESITVASMQKAVNREVARKSISFSAYSQNGSQNGGDSSQFISNDGPGSANNSNHTQLPIPEATSEEEASSSRSLAASAEKINSARALSARVLNNFTKSEIEGIEEDYASNSEVEEEAPQGRRVSLVDELTNDSTKFDESSSGASGDDNV